MNTPDSPQEQQKPISSVREYEEEIDRYRQMHDPQRIMKLPPIGDPQLSEEDLYWRRKLRLKGLKAMSNPHLVFRGQSNVNWEAIPGLYRKADTNNGKSRRIYSGDSESKMLRELIINCRDDFDQDQFMFERLARAQHHGLPTRLLDVTSCHLVALYFACTAEENKSNDGSVFIYFPYSRERKDRNTDVITVLSNLALLTEEERSNIESYVSSTSRYLTTKEIKKPDIFLQTDGDRDTFQSNAPCFNPLYKLVREDSPNFSLEVKKENFREIYLAEWPSSTVQRMINQKGALLIGTIRNNSRKSPDKTIHIPGDAKKKLLAELNEKGINQKTLFRTDGTKSLRIDVCAKQIREKYKSNSTTSVDEH